MHAGRLPEQGFCHLVAKTFGCSARPAQVHSRYRHWRDLTKPNSVRNFRQFFVSLNRSTSGRFSGGTNFYSTNVERIGANDARHREYLMALARQLTSSATLKGKGCRGKSTPAEVRH